MKRTLKIDRNLDKHLKALKSDEGELSSLEISTAGNGARVSGDLDVTGTINSPTVYAGQILGYTAIGIDATRDSVSVVGSFATTDTTHQITFVAPTSGKVEIEVSISVITTSVRQLFFGLSDSAIYSPIDFPNSNDVTNEHNIGDIKVEGFAREFTHKWVVEGLTAGTLYNWYLGAKAEQAGRITLWWGGDDTGEYAPFIMKATALPIGIHTG